MEKSILDQTINYFKYKVFKIKECIDNKKHTQTGTERLQNQIRLYEYAISMLELKKEQE